MKSDTSSIRRNRSLPIIEPELLGRVLASAADLSIVMTPDGTTTAVLVNPNAESMGNLGHWEGRPLRDFLTEESIPKLERVLRKAAIGEGDGLSVELHGVVDRLDLGPDGGATVVDYKLRGARVNWARFLAGQQLQLPAYLLAVRTAGAAGEAQPVQAVAAEYQPVEPRWQSNGEADFAPQRVPPVMKKAEQQDRLAGLLPEALNHTQRIIGELAERMLAGEVGPLPLLSPREKGWTACGLCDYRSVCRFDPLAGERYRQASGRGDAELRDAIAAGGDFSGSARGDGPEVQR